MQKIYPSLGASMLVKIVCFFLLLGNQVLHF
jgi:hypothetical protein